jgi:acyl carrier protein
VEQTATIASTLRKFILDTYWSADETRLTDTTDLVDAGVVDSMNVLKLVDFIEEEFDFMLEPEDLFLMTTIASTVELIRDKTGS